MFVDLTCQRHRLEIGFGRKKCYLWFLLFQRSYQLSVAFQMPTAIKNYAHSLQDRPVEDWETMQQHEDRVAQRCSQFLERINPELNAWGDLLGRWHIQNDIRMKTTSLIIWPTGVQFA